MLCASIILIGTQCSEESNVKQDRNQNVNFTFGDKVVTANFLFDPSFKTFELVSNEMTVKIVKDSETRKIVYVYTLKSIENSNTSARVEGGSIKVGYYGYSDGCWYWGKLFTGSDGTELFVLGDQAYNPPICEPGIWALVQPKPKCYACNFPF